MKLESFEMLSLGMVIANDVVAFDGHVILLFENCELEMPITVWQFKAGPLFAGKDHVRFKEQVEKAIKRSKTSRGVKSTGFMLSQARYLLIPLFYQDVPMGHLLVHRKNEKTMFSETDVRLLQASMRLTIGAMHDQRVAALLGRIHFEFLQRRTALLQAKDPKSVISEYIRKLEDVIYPISEPLILSVNAPIVRTYAAIANRSKTALYVTSFQSTELSDQSSDIAKRRFSSNDKYSVISNVFKSGEPYCNNNVNHKIKEGINNFHDTLSIISAPVTLGNETGEAVLTSETTEPNAFDMYDVAAFSLLAGHCAKPLGRALDRELATRRTRDARNIATLVVALQACTTWEHITHVLINGLRSLDYHCGMISRVDYVKAVIIGETSWAFNKERRKMWKRLCDKTRRAFLKDNNDCQIQALRTKRPQVVHDPLFDLSVHPDAVSSAPLGPFAIIPLMDHEGKVIRTLHVERSDFAPLDVPEIDNLQEICRAVSSVVERLNEASYGQKVAELTRKWSHALQTRFVRRQHILKEFADFVFQNKLCMRCRIFNIQDADQVGIYYSGAKLKHVRQFEGLKLSNQPLLTAMRRNFRLLVCVPSRVQERDLRGTEFQVEHVWPVRHRLRFEKADEWIEIPFVVGGQLVAKAVLDKSDKRLSSANQKFSLRELRFLTMLGRLTSAAMERTDLEIKLLHQAVVGGAVEVFRHEIKNKLIDLDHNVNLLPDQKSPSIKALLTKIVRVRRGIDRLKTFFSAQLKQGQTPRRRSLSIKDEIVTACELLPKDSNTKIKYAAPIAPVKIYSVGSQRPLCLILLQLLQNAQKHGDGKALLFFTPGRDGKPHVVKVQDNGVGISKSLATEINSNAWSPVSTDMGIGLQTAKLLAAGQGWRLGVTRIANPTRFVVEIPTEMQT